MSWWQHAVLSKVALLIKIDRETERRYFSGSPTAWHFRNAVLSVFATLCCCTQRAWMSRLSVFEPAQRRNLPRMAAVRRKLTAVALYHQIIWNDSGLVRVQLASPAMCGNRSDNLDDWETSLVADRCFSWSDSGKICRPRRWRHSWVTVGSDCCQLNHNRTQQAREVLTRPKTAF